MLVFVFYLLMVFSPFAMIASTGTIDHRASHNCWINCEQRGLYQGEYHEHEESRGHHHDGILEY
jgi:hypothetical protein